MKKSNTDYDEEDLSLNNNNVNNRAVRNIIIVLIGNIVTIISSVLIGFIVPKMMSLGDYAWYKTFTLYYEYTDILTFGLLDGIYLFYAGTSYDKLDKMKFRMFSKFVIFTQFIFSIIICFISLFFLSTEYGFVFLFVGIASFMVNVLNYLQFLSRITERYKELSLRNIIKSSLNILFVGGLYILFKLNYLKNLDFRLYIVITVSILFLTMIAYLFRYRELFIGKSLKVLQEKDTFLSMYKYGFPILISNFVTSLILIIDRQFVNLLFDKDTYGLYSFAYSMLGFINIAISTIATVLLPMLKRIPKDELPLKYNKFISILCIVVSVMLFGYFPIKFICIYFLKDYYPSLVYLRIVMPGLMLSSCITIIMHNYYKVMDSSFNYFIKSLVILCVSFLLNTIAYIAFKDAIMISIASVITYLIWFIIVEFRFFKLWGRSNIKNFIFIIVVISSFYIITGIENVYISGLIYVGVLLLEILIFNYKLIKNLIVERKII